ncbi:MAG: ABC transporter substrate-binding protein [Coriobacteriaceae bacterium]|nr:ABC transporter substrate-binding protein [Coriobacteriaceae bacterium]
MSCLTGKSFNPVVNRRGVIAGLAGMGVMGLLAGCSDEGAPAGSGSGDAAAFKIGTIGPLTGANASYGTSVCNGAELGCKDFSTDELAFAFKSEDDVADGEKSVNAFNSLADWGMQALVGPTTTGASIAVAEVANSDPQIFMITPSASAPDVTADKTCVFQACFNDPNQGANAAKKLAEMFGDEKFVVFYNSGDTYSSGIRDAFMEKAEELKLEIVDEETFKDDSQTSFTTQLTKAKDKGATMIFAPIYYTPASVLLANAKDMGYDVKMMGCDGMDGILGVEGFDTSLAEGLYLMTPFSADDPKNEEFVTAYKDAYGETPDQFAADAYDSVHAVALALAEAGLAADADPTEVAEALPEAMTKITVEGLTGTLTWNDKGEVEKDPMVYVIQDGKYVAA